MIRVSSFISSISQPICVCRQNVLFVCQRHKKVLLKEKKINEDHSDRGRGGDVERALANTLKKQWRQFTGSYHFDTEHFCIGYIKILRLNLLAFAQSDMFILVQKKITNYFYRKFYLFLVLCQLLSDRLTDERLRKLTRWIRVMVFF